MPGQIGKSDFFNDPFVIEDPSVGEEARNIFEKLPVHRPEKPKSKDKKHQNNKQELPKV